MGAGELVGVGLGAAGVAVAGDFGWVGTGVAVGAATDGAAMAVEGGGAVFPTVGTTAVGTGAAAGAAPQLVATRTKIDIPMRRWILTLSTAFPLRRFAPLWSAVACHSFRFDRKPLLVTSSSQPLLTAGQEARPQPLGRPRLLVTVGRVESGAKAPHSKFALMPSGEERS